MNFLHQKYIILKEEKSPNLVGIGEVQGVIPGEN